MGRVTCWLLALAVSLSVAGCSSEDGSPSRDAVPDTVETVLADAADAMGQVESAHFTITRTGAEVYIDQENRFRFDAAEGRYAAPASADAVITVNALGFSAEVGAVVINGEASLTNPLSGRWESAPEDFTFDPSVLFAPETGWRSLLSQGLTGAELVEDGGADGDEADRDHVVGTVAADRVALLTGGLVDQPSTVDIWFDASSGRIDELSFDAPVSAGMSSWRMTLDDYDASVTVTMPQLGSTG